MKNYFELLPNQQKQNSMIYGNSLPFDELLERIKLLENRFRHTNC